MVYLQEAEEESEISQTETSMTEIAPETEKPVIPVKHTKKISLNSKLAHWEQ